LFDFSSITGQVINTGAHSGFCSGFVLNEFILVVTNESSPYIFLILSRLRSNAHVIRLILTMSSLICDCWQSEVSLVVYHCPPPCC